MKTMGEELIEQGHQQGWIKGRSDGLAEGRAQAVLRFLAARGIAVDERTRALILSCKDLDTLDRWIDAAPNASSLSDLELGG